MGSTQIEQAFSSIFFSFTDDFLKNCPASPARYTLKKSSKMAEKIDKDKEKTCSSCMNAITQCDDPKPTPSLVSHSQ